MEELLASGRLFDYEAFKQDAAGKTCVLYGLGDFTKNIVERLQGEVPLAYIADEDFRKWGKKIKGLAVCSPHRLRQENPAETLVLVGNEQVFESGRRLEAWGFPLVYAYYLFWDRILEDHTIEGVSVYF